MGGSGSDRERYPLELETKAVISALIKLLSEKSTGVESRLYF